MSVKVRKVYVLTRDEHVFILPVDLLYHSEYFSKQLSTEEFGTLHHPVYFQNICGDCFSAVVHYLKYRSWKDENDENSVNGENSENSEKSASTENTENTAADSHLRNLQKLIPTDGAKNRFLEVLDFLRIDFMMDKLDMEKMDKLIL